VNFREKWRGYLWQGRFASFVMDEPYLPAAAQDPTKDTVNLYGSAIPPGGPNNKHAINPLDYVLAVSGPWSDL
jgi:hypothetical protein